MLGYEKNDEISCKLNTHSKYLFAGKLYTKHQKHWNHFCCIHCFGALFDINNAKLFFHNNGELKREKIFGPVIGYGHSIIDYKLRNLWVYEYVYASVYKSWKC